MIVVLMLLAASAIPPWSIGGKVFSRVKKAGGSFLSSNDPRELLGAGQTRLDRVEMQWPAPNHHVARYLTVTEGGT